MSNVLALLLLVVLAGIALLIYREYRRSRVQRAPLHTEALADMLDGRRDEAFDKLREVANQDSNNVDAYLRLAELLTARGDNERAGRIYQMLTLRRNLKTADEQKILFAQAREHLRHSRLTKAISVLEQIGEKDPRNVQSREMLLFCYLQAENWDEVKALVEELVRVQKDKQRSALYLTEAAARLFAREPETAIRYFERARELDPKSLAVLVYSGDAAWEQGRMDEAVRQWKEALSRRPELSAMVRERMEKAFYESGRYDELVRVYDELLVRAPHDPGIYVALGRILAKKGDLDRAWSALDRVPAELKDDALIRLFQAELRLGRGEVELARQELARLAEKLGRRRFRCDRCGFLAEAEFSWHCPHCGAWDSFAVATRNS